ncbi:unnamed protein product, partial [Heterosigma akashiwo]
MSLLLLKQVKSRAVLPVGRPKHSRRCLSLRPAAPVHRWRPVSQSSVLLLVAIQLGPEGAVPVLPLRAARAQLHHRELQRHVVPPLVVHRQQQGGPGVRGRHLQALGPGQPAALEVKVQHRDD